MSRADVSKVKAFISRSTDRFRPPYGRRIIESPRTCVYWGTTNGSDYLKDETGGRRYLPVKIGRIDIGSLEADRDQLWAEAVKAYKAGAPWWITDRQTLADAEQQQRDRYVGDPWDDRIGKFTEGREFVAIEEILQDALHIETARLTQVDQNRAARCLKSMGWERKQRRIGGKPKWGYVRPVTDNVSSPSLFDDVTSSDGGDT
jgi:predicted P-loop ATPase